MIAAANNPEQRSGKETASGTRKSRVDGDGGDGRRADRGDERDGTDAIGKRDADARQCGHAHGIPQARPVAPLERAQRAAQAAFPPPGVEVVSWYVMMGIGQVVTLRLPASRLREVNRLLEDKAWGAYRTEFYPTYDYKAVGMAAHDKAQ